MEVSTSLYFSQKGMSSGMRDIDPSDIERLVAVRGIVIRCSDLIPDMNTCFFKCTTEQCDTTVENGIAAHKVLEPQICEGCGAKQSFEVRHNMCSFGDKQ